jgi:hypothetical protein
VKLKLPNYLAISVYGPFHRKWSPTQTDDDVERVLQSGELWGGPGFGSDIPAVKAHVGPLPAGEAGFEFYARVIPDNDAGSRIYWRRRDDGSVRQNDGMAKMPIMVSRVRRRA